MESSINPFTPSFGKVPPILAGRKILIGEFESVQLVLGSPRCGKDGSYVAPCAQGGGERVDFG